MSEYTPTKEEVREAWARYIDGSYNPEREAEFDRMIEQVRAEERKRILKAADRLYFSGGYSCIKRGMLERAIRAVSEEQKGNQ